MDMDMGNSRKIITASKGRLKSLLLAMMCLCFCVPDRSRGGTGRASTIKG